MIDSKLLKKAIISAINNISLHREEVDSMNIFPVPDGDTGTNMSLTISSAKPNLENKDYNTVSDLAADVATSMLMGSRGNSGVILSLLFRGFADGLKSIETASAEDIVNALGLGVKSAYTAVENPIEGTILTVARSAYEGGKAKLCQNSLNNNIKSVFDAIYTSAIEALNTTPQLLPVLKKAGVVDAGGKGFCLVLEGMLSVIKDDICIGCNNNLENKKNSQADFFSSAVSEFDDDIRFTYCTEFVVSKSESSDGVCKTCENKFRKFLKPIGDCIVIAEDSKLIKIHVHTESPGIVLQKALSFGELISVKVENMKEQHRKAQNLKASDTSTTECIKNGDKKLEKADPVEEFGFVAVAAGSGLEALFHDLGCTHVVSGGQSMNPSTDDIYEAIMATPAKNVFILPNNKNIILAANQSSHLVKDRCVKILPTKTIPEGISAIMSFDPSLSMEINKNIMQEAISKVSSGQVTFAARKSEFGGFKIEKGDIIALDNGKLTYVDKDPIKATLKLVKHMVNSHTSFVTLFQGKSISDEDANKCLQILQSKLSQHIEVNLIKSLQPVYYFIISIE